MAIYSTFLYMSFKFLLVYNMIDELTQILFRSQLYGIIKEILELTYITNWQVKFNIIMGAIPISSAQWICTFIICA